MAYAPLQRLHAAHGCSGNRNHMIDAEVVQQKLLALDHVPDRKFGEIRTVLALAVAGAGREPVADRISCNDEELVGVDRLARADEEVDAVVVARDGRDHQHHIGFVVVQLAMGDVRDREVLDDLAVFELEVANWVELVGRVIRSVSQRGRPSERNSAYHKQSNR
jgi:hypothetical protein